MTEQDVAETLRELAHEARILQNHIRGLLPHDLSLVGVSVSAIQDVNEQLAGLVCRMEKLATFAESRQNLSLCD